MPKKRLEFSLDTDCPDQAHIYHLLESAAVSRSVAAIAKEILMVFTPAAVLQDFNLARRQQRAIDALAQAKEIDSTPPDPILSADSSDSAEFNPIQGF